MPIYLADIISVLTLAAGTLFLLVIAVETVVFFFASDED